ncbi:unnamed protein product [Vitrella brassicaformis CCMP3155]|uniref:ATP synthase F1 complex delta/epsilon subunit N-terminal domain-containing protein n=1 Tax=Vitrella brassicaformis (strain CCMP3155) TaxID=1169540 RepID=A0A0G4EET2_VITBC|nr:unnamed protein product [Vitrella brassicaformis CCMP3155]|mmetsp:Transcript_10353/g.25046  ORF Transcript_10353/g.25046 Transcript_10353/m.25046 type:complete len:156 (-) Transcript_10353:599-1066(-)|eukprot:CEL94049.1 unnamed protein product [Vitrella brassicaformis CCMP3155]
MFRLSRLLRFAAPEGVKNRLLLTLSSPSESIYLQQPIDSVTVPGIEGAFTLTNNHSQTVSMLGPGVVTVRVSPNDKKDYFLSDGFVFFSAPSDESGCCAAEVVGVEVVPTDALDKDKAAQVMADLLAAPKDTDWDKTKALLGQTLCANIIKAASV